MCWGSGSMRTQPSLVIDGILTVIGEGSRHHHRCQRVFIHQSAICIRMGDNLCSARHPAAHTCRWISVRPESNAFPSPKIVLSKKNGRTRKTRLFFHQRTTATETPCTRMTPILSHMKQKDLSPGSFAPYIRGSSMNIISIRIIARPEYLRTPSRARHATGPGRTRWPRNKGYSRLQRCTPRPASGPR